MYLKPTREERSWILYDWANSAYSIIITTAIFPLFYQTVTSEATYLSTWAYGNSAASLFVAILAPILGTIADYRSRKKKFFSFFLTVGVGTTVAMFFIGEGQWLFAILIYALSVVGFAGANLFYDAFLVDVTTNERMDRVSAAGFGFGYIGGSTIPFVITIAMILNYEALGFESQEAVYRLSFLMTAAWWALFSIPILRNVKQHYAIEPSPTPVRDSFSRLRDTFRDMSRYRNIFVFLAAYFFYIEGVNTVIRMATPIAVSMGIGQTTLILVLLVIQVTAFPFAILYGRLAKVFTGRRMIFVGIFIYGIVAVLAFLMPSFEDMVTRTRIFWLVAILVASSQGGIQALSRSYFGKLVPKRKSSEFFGFYNIVGKFSAIVGPFLVGTVTWMTGEERFGVLSVLALFLIGGLILMRTKRETEIVPDVPPTDT
ncbi:MAG: MFS transporter [Spirochaetes bacterium]|jgi:UMF1 family MFS transporter|nr:MFS transporter [Spirochaetota bacterium]